MGIFIDKKMYIAAALTAVTVCILMVICPDMAVLSAKKGIMLWFSDVLPALLPFFICINFLNSIGVVKGLPLPLFTFTVSAMSGYPMGAKVTGDLYRNGYIDGNYARRLASFCSTSGPAFMIGAVGVGMLGSETAGTIIALSHYAGAAINGMFYSVLLPGGTRKCSLKKETVQYNLMEELTKSIFSAFKSMAIILSFIIFFMFIMDVAEYFILPDTVEGPATRGVIKGFLEMTMGCAELSDPCVSLRKASTLASMMISWGGLSVIGQSSSMLAGTGITVKFIIFTKATHSIFSGIIALFMGSLML